MHVVKFKMADKESKKDSNETLALDSEKQKEFEEKVKKIKPKDSSEDLTPGVIYLGHIPHGFYEHEIRGFFQQFGSVNRVRLSRSVKVGRGTNRTKQTLYDSSMTRLSCGVRLYFVWQSARSKGYAFVEFECDEVAKIAAETMDNYIMFGRVLKCKVVSPEKIHPRLWKGSNRKFQYVPRRENEIKKQNKERTQEEHEKNIRNLLKKQSRKRKNLEKLGVSYKFPGYEQEAEDTQPKHKRFSAASPK
ncbi:hypothetical protein QZH41_014944 [Actinostola sp. cb2023]|nr:hypothetical protein QZH41_014944 [Actinostola sp. cb2023]